MSKQGKTKSLPAKLRAAIKSSNKDIVLDILENNTIDLNERVSDDTTYLHLALHNTTEGKSKCQKIIEILTILLDRGMNIEVKNKFGQTVLQCAAFIRSTEIVGFLIEHNADINVIDGCGNSIVHTFIDTEFSRFKRIPSNTSGQIRESREKKSIDFINFLISKGFDVDCRNKQGLSALHKAINFNLHHILPNLFASTNDINFIDKSGRTLLQIFLNVNYDDYQHRPTTEYYGDRYIPSIIKILLDKGVPLDNADKQGETALQFVFERSNISLMKLLVDHAVENDFKCLTKFLHHLIKYDIKNYLDTVKEINDLEDMLKTLVSKTSRFQNVPVSQNTTVQLAVLEKRLDILKLLSIHKIGFDTLTSDGKSLLHLLSQDIFPNRTRHCSDEEYEEMFDILMSQGCDVNATDRMKGTPLHEAVAYGKIPIMKKLIVHGVDVNSKKDGLMWTPLHLAADTDQSLEVAQVLITNGANVNLKDTCGRTPLHLTLEKSGMLTQLLLSSGARADVQDKRKRTPLYLAISRKHLQEVDELLKYGANFDDFFPIQSHVRLLNEDPTRGRILLDFVLPTHWIKLSVVGLPCSTQYKTLVEGKNFQCCYNDFREEIEKLKSSFIDDRITVLNFLQMYPNRRCTYINSEKLKNFIDSPLHQTFPNYSNVILAAYHDALARRPLLEPAMQGWCELTNIVLPDICVDRILSFLGVADLLHLTSEE